MTFCWPTRSTRTPYSLAARTLPSTSGRGAWSPPMASTAIVIIGDFPATLTSSVGTTRAVPFWTLRARLQPGYSTLRRAPDAPCNTRNADRHGAAVSFRGNLGTWPSLGQRDDRARVSCWSAFWNVVVWGLALHCSLFSPRSRQHTSPSRSGSDSMGFWPENLLFLEPVLLQPREGSQARIGRVRLTAALFMVQVGPATGAQSPAIALADYFHRQ